MSFAVLAVGVTGVGPVSTVRAEGPRLEGPWTEPFADATKTRSAAEEIPTDEEQGVVCLFEESTLTFDEQGRVELDYRLVYRVDSEQAVRGWSAVSRRWKPWHQERPVLEGRVIAPDGGVAWLDPANLAEYNDDDSGPDVYADTRTYKGPLPGLKVGSIAEERHRVKDTAPAFDAGSVYGFRFGRSVPVDGTRMTIDAPSGLGVRHKLYDLPDARVTAREEGGRTLTVIEHGPLPAQDTIESRGPGDLPRYPLVRVSSSPSWQAVATRYHEIVEDRLADADLRKLVKKTLGRERDRAKVIALLLEEVHRRVRYTGVEFGERAIVPTGPTQTLERGFGDCKDKATLLIGMLREAGIPAYVALLDAGTGHDVDPDLPGMGLFDHAIVYVPPARDGPEVWIDPTHRFARAGELPASDQRRQALVARPETTAPVLTPVDPPSANRRVQRREVFLAAEGLGRVKETTRVHGEFERDYRLNYSALSEADLHDVLERYVQNQYMGESLVSMEVSDVEDLSRPLKIEVEVDEVRRAPTAPTEANVYIPTGPLFSALPSETRPGSDEDEDEDEPRKTPLLLTQPYVEEWEYLIHPPPGYEVQSTPDDTVTAIGPGKFTQSYTVNDDGTVRAKLTFDTVTDTLTPEQVVAVREAVRTIYEGNAATVSFRGVGETLLESGNIKEALIEFQRLGAAYPDEPVHHTQKARAYLAAGLGEEARREARLAVRLAPDSYVAHVVLGRILAHDTLGRKFVHGFDQPGAESAFRRAIELDPDEFEARGELAILLEHDAEGQRYAPGARLEESIELYEYIREELEIDGLTANLMVALAHLGRWEDLRTLTEEAPRDPARDGMRVAAFAVIDGAPAAIEEAKRLTSGAETFRQALIGASDWLVTMRVYGAAADLMVAGSRGTPEAVPRLTQAASLRKLKRHEEIEIDPKRPEGVARRFVRDLVLSEEAVREVAEQLPDGVVESIGREELVDHLIELRREVLWSLVQEGVGLDQALDTLLAPGTARVDAATSGEDDGWRVRFFDPSGTGRPWLVVYVAREGGTLRAVSTSDMLSTAAEWVLALEAKGELDAARQWIDWMREDLAGTPAPDPLAEAPIRRLWRPDGARDAMRVRLAAAALLAPPFGGRRKIELLQAEDRSKLTEDERTGYDLALGEAAAEDEDYELALKVGTRLNEAHPESMVAFMARADALLRLERYDEADKLIQARLAANPDDALVMAMKTDVPGAKHDFEEWRARLKAAVETGNAMAGTYNNLAWLDIVEHRIDEETLQLAQESVVRSDYTDTAALHTLATVFAEMGYVAEARDVVLALLNNRGVGQLESPDWYVLGRIAEEYGALQSARDSYSRIDAPEEPDPASTHSLAVYRLSRMDEAKDE